MTLKASLLMAASLAFAPSVFAQDSVVDEAPAEPAPKKTATASDIDIEASIGYNSHEWGDSAGVAVRLGGFKNINDNWYLGLEGEYIFGGQSYETESQTEFVDLRQFGFSDFVTVDREYGHDSTAAIYAIAGIGDENYRIFGRLGYHTTELKDEYTVRLPGATPINEVETQSGWAAGISMSYFFGQNLKNGIRMDVTETQTEDVVFVFQYDDGTVQEESGRSTLISFSYVRRF